MKSEFAVTKVKEIRLNISRALNSFNLVNSTREVALAKTSLQRAFAWMGQSLKYLGQVSPYTESHNSQSKKIEDLADATDDTLLKLFEQNNSSTQTARIKDWRVYLQEILRDVNNLFEPLEEDSDDIQPVKFLQCVDQAQVSLIDAKHWFGWELGSIRDQIKAKESLTDGAAPIPVKLELV